MALIYNRLDIKLESGAISNLPLPNSIYGKSENDFIADSFVVSMKAGVVVSLDTTTKGIRPAGKANDVAIGFLVNDLAGFANQSINGLVAGSAAVLVGSGNQFVTDNVVDSDITAGAPLYVADDTGLLTKTQGTNITNPVAVAISGNSATNKAILVHTLI